MENQTPQEPKPINLANGSVQHFTEEDAWNALRECYDPEIPVNIVDLGLVYEMKIEGEKISITMTLTAPGCGMGPMIANDVKSRLLQLPGVSEADVKLVFSPLWTTSMMSEDAKKMLGMP